MSIFNKKINKRTGILPAASLLFLFVLLHAWLAAAASQKLLEDITFEAPSDNEERIIFKLNGTHIPKIFSIDGEQPRVVFDFTDTTTAKIINNIINTNGKLIKRIRVGIHEGPNPKTRVVLDLLPNKEIDYEQNFDKKKNALIVTVHYAGVKPTKKPVVKKPAPPVAAKPKPTEKKTVVTARPAKPVAKPAATTEKKPKTTVTAKVADTAKKAEPAASAKTTTPRAVEQALDRPTVQAPETPIGPPLLTSITFDNSSNRGEMILFKLNEFHPPIVFGLEEGQPRVVCDFKGTTAATDLPDSIKTDGKFVQQIRISKKNKTDKVRVVLDLAANNSYDLQQVFFKEDNLFVIIINTLADATTAEPEKLLR
jgi:hypothetical protein